MLIVLPFAPQVVTFTKGVIREREEKEQEKERKRKRTRERKRIRRARDRDLKRQKKSKIILPSLGSRISSGKVRCNCEPREKNLLK